jgi:hypothetical protein
MENNNKVNAFSILKIRIHFNNEHKFYFHVKIKFDFNKNKNEQVFFLKDKRLAFVYTIIAFINMFDILM